MYQMYVEDRKIDIELLNLSTGQFLAQACSSLCEKKYLYLGSNVANCAAYYFYSDQCMLRYDNNLHISYKTFAERLLLSPPSIDDFGKHQQQEVEWLIYNEFLEVGLDGVVRIKNIHAVGFLGEIYRNGCLSYLSYSREQQLVLDSMLDDGLLSAESTLFSRPEADYLDFHLNRRKFINSLDLRNKYAHGSHSGSQGDENQVRNDYLQLLKIVICVVLKINNDLCGLHSLE
jgi:hypothetical protein